MRKVLAVMVLLTVLAAGSRVHAQESILPLPLERSSVTDALARANREHRVLIVVYEWKRPPFGRRPWWVNDTVKAWIKWHALLVECNQDDPENREYLQTFPRSFSSRSWGFEVIMNRGRCDLGPLPAIPDADNKDDMRDSVGAGLSAVTVLFQIDFQLEKVRINHPVWAAGHEIDCTEPKQPKRRCVYGEESDGVPATSDAPTPRDGERYVDVLERVREADRLITAGERAKAFALLTWAWERGPELDPAFALARVGLVLPRMTALRKADPALGKRMEQIGEAELELYPWYDDRDELSYLCLRYHAGEKDKVIQRAIVENLDLDEQTMAGVVPARLADLKARITELATEPTISPADWKSVMSIVRCRAPTGAPRDIKDRWGRARVELAATAAVRTYAALLASDNPADRTRAETLAQDVLKEAAAAPVVVRASLLRALVMAAVSVGKADSGHAAWLDEAARIDPPSKGKAAGDPLRKAVGVGSK